MEATEAAVEAINERAEELHVETREVIVEAVQAQFKKHLGTDEDPDVSIARFKLQLEAATCFKRARQQEKKKDEEEAKRLRQEQRKKPRTA